MTTASDTEIFQLANHFLGKADIDFAGYSGGGIHVVGGKDSIAKVKDAVFAAGMIPKYRDSILDLDRVLNQTRVDNALLQSSINLLKEQVRLDTLEKDRLKNELTAMDQAAMSRMDLDAMVHKHSISHVLLGLECIAHEEGIIRRQNNEPRAVSDHWRIFGDSLGKLARNNSDMEVTTL